MTRFPIRSIWLQSMVVLAVIVGVFAADISVAQARVAANHRRDAARKLHRAEAAYVAKVDALSRALFVNVQPVQNALDHLDASRPQYLDASRDAVVNSATAAKVAKLDTQLMQIRPTTTFTAQHKALHADLVKMNRSLRSLEHGKKSKDPTDLLDEPYSGASYNLSDAEDSWEKTLLQLDTATHHREAPSPGSVGSKRPHVALAPSKASWIFSADAACGAGSQAIYRLPEPSSSASLETVARFEDRYAAIVTKVNSDLRRIKLPAADVSYLKRTIYKSLKANDTMAASARSAARGLRARSIGLLNQSIQQEHIARKGLGSLAKQMTSYGAEYCGWFFTPVNKSDSNKSGGSSGVSA